MAGKCGVVKGGGIVFANILLSTPSSLKALLLSGVSIFMALQMDSMLASFSVQEPGGVGRDGDEKRLLLFVR